MRIPTGLVPPGAFAPALGLCLGLRLRLCLWLWRLVISITVSSILVSSILVIECKVRIVHLTMLAFCLVVKPVFPEWLLAS
jgi:hypothetical protein